MLAPRRSLPIVRRDGLPGWFWRSKHAASALAEDELRHSRLPSGWTPLELLKHLRYVELRWIESGFEGRDVGEP
jgi:hypothetical protein